MDDDRPLSGQRALVVGGYGGLGTTIIEHLADAGAAVAIAGRSKDRAAALAAQLGRRGVDTAVVPMDLTDRADVNRAIDDLVADWSEIDIMINCAGRLVTTPALEFDEGDWRAVLDANLTGAFWLSQAVGRHMVAAGTHGRIVHLSSVRSVAGGRLGFSAYGAAKAGLNLLVMQLATEWAKYRITVNAVAPGFVTTDLVEQNSRNDAFVGRMLARIPLGRFAEPAEIAGAVDYLVSPVARFVTGQVLFVDGGVTASQ